MPNQNTITSKLYNLVEIDANSTPTKVKNTYIPAPTIDGLKLGGVKAGPNIVIDVNGTISTTGGGGGGTAIEVNGALVPPTSAVINFVNSTDFTNNISFFNLATNQISAEINPRSVVIATGVQITDTGSNFGVSLQYPAVGSNYTLTFPGAQGTANTILRNDGTGILSWVAANVGTVSNVSVVAPLSGALQFVNQTSTPQLGIINATDPANQFLSGAGMWQVPRGLGTVVSIDNVSQGLEVNFEDSPTTDAGTIFNVLLGNNVQAKPYLYSVENNKQFKQMNITGSGVTTSVDANGLYTVNISGGGGGGGAFSSSAIWTGGTSNKNAYTAPGVVNNQGITLNLIASSGSGQISNATISLNGVALAGTFVSTGTFPNYTITIPVASLSGVAAEVAATVSVSVIGTFSGSAFNIANAGTLTNNQPIPFTSTLTGSYGVSALPYYTTVATLNYNYTNGANITVFSGVFTPGGNATAVSGSFANTASSGSTISGSVTGNGQFGAGVAVVTLTGSIPAVPTYIPAFYAGASTGATAPVFTTGSSQTTGAEVGSTITYAVATASTQYVWLVTTRPITSVRQMTAFGLAVITADVTTTQMIAGTTFNVFGFTLLSTTTAVQLTIIS